MTEISFADAQVAIEVLRAALKEAFLDGTWDGIEKAEHLENVINALKEIKE